MQDDEDRRASCEHSGKRLLETTESNLPRGMGWLQNAFTRRINTRHRLRGEPANCSELRLITLRQSVRSFSTR